MLLTLHYNSVFLIDDIAINTTSRPEIKKHPRASTKVEVETPTPIATPAPPIYAATPDYAAGLGSEYEPVPMVRHRLDYIRGSGHVS